MKCAEFDVSNARYVSKWNWAPGTNIDLLIILKFKFMVNLI